MAQKAVQIEFTAILAAQSRGPNICKQLAQDLFAGRGVFGRIETTRFTTAVAVQNESGIYEHLTQIR